MALIPKRDLLKEAMEDGMVMQDKREYIGMSGLMGKCRRAIWYNFHWACDRYVDARIARIFERGDLEEARVVRDLRAKGVICTNVLEDQIELVDDTGHIRGHPDGKALNVPTAEKTEHCLEIKTMKASLFSAYKKNGLEASNPPYWGQVHTYMGEQKLTRALFTVTNKDTEERHYERINYDPKVHEECMSIGFDVLTSEFPPKKIGEVTWFECKMCACKGICHKGEPINRNCRTCKNFNIEMEGKFACDLHKEYGDLTRAWQLKGCDDYELDEVFE